MTNRWKLCVAALAVVCLLLGSDAWARRPGHRPRPRPPLDPAQIAAKCTQGMQMMADRCADRNQRAAGRCVAKIDDLLEAGQVDEAVAMADHCIDRINRSSDMCIRMIERTCEMCVRLLERLEADQALIDGLNAKCAELTDDDGPVRTSQDDAVGLIQNALP